MVLGLAAVAPLTPAAVAGPMDGPGCIGVRLDECLRWLRATMTVNEQLLANSLLRRHQTDVNGRPLGGGGLPIYATLPGGRDIFVIRLHLRPDDTVERAESSLRLDLNTVHTEQLYDQSGLYDILWRLLGRRCPTISKIELYRFFENSVKPRITRQRRDFSAGLYGLHVISSHAPGVSYCGGVSLAYTSLLQWRGGKEAEAAANPSEFSSIELQ